MQPRCSGFFALGRLLFRFAISVGILFLSSVEYLLAQPVELPPTITPPSRVPPGFESLLEPQTTIVDVYFAGEFVDAQLATFTNGEIRFSDPNKIVEKIPTLLDPQAVQNAMTGGIPTHTELVCYYSGQDNCGDLEPGIAGVIFNDGIFRADLFINNQYLSISNIAHRKFLPASDGDLSWLQTINAAYSGSRDDESDILNLNSGSTFAFRENRFQIISNYENDRDFAVDTAAFRRDWHGKEYQAGYFRSNSGNFQFMGDAPIRGLRVASTLDTREDLRQSAGNSIQVFLPTRSEVSLYKDDRLLSSRIYDAGNQELDTSQLPGGAYDVTIRIRDSAGVVEEETRFYVKSSLLPPADQALYFVEAGELLDPEDDKGLASGDDLSLLRAGYHARFGDQFAYLAGLSQIEDHSNLEIGASYLGRYVNIDIGGFSGNDSRRGARFDFRGNYAGLYFNANYRRIWNDNFDPDDRSDFTGESSTQSFVSLTTQLPLGRIELSGRLNRRSGDSTETYTTRYEFPRLRVGPSEFYMGVQLSQEEGINTGLFTLEMRLNGDHVTGQIRPEYAYQSESDNFDETNDWQSSGIVSWQDRDIWQDQDLRLDLRARDQFDQQSIGTEMDLITQSGRLRLQAEKIDQDGRELTRYTGNGFTSFMVNSQHAKLGGRDQSQSALLIAITGEVKDARFDIIVDGNVRAVGYAGKITALNLRPFETYSVQLRQQGASFVEYEEQPRQVTLYPGNVITLNWQVAELDIIFGRVLDQNNQAVENALISGITGVATTDDVGLFQAEIRRDVKTIKVETLTQACNIPIPAYQVNRGIANLGNLRCDLRDK
jgi:hypothetical protein